MFKQLLDEVIPEYKDKITFYKVNIENEIDTIGDDLNKLYKLFFNVMSEFSGLTDNEIKTIYPTFKG